MRNRTISIISAVIVLVTLDVITYMSEPLHAKEITDVRESKNLSDMAKKLLGDRLFKKWKIKVWVGNEKEMGDWLGGSNPNGDVVINSKYLGIPDDEMALLLGHEIAHVRLGHDRGLLRKHFSKRSVLETFSEPLLEYYYVKFAREQEFAADEWALKLLINAKYNPDKALNLYRKLAEKEGILKKMVSKIVKDPSFSQRLKKLEDIFYEETSKSMLKQAEEAKKALEEMQKQRPQKWPFQESPQVSMYPSSGTVWTTLTVTGWGFSPNRPATVYGRRPDGSVWQTTVQTDSSGAYSRKWTAQTPGNNFAWWAVDNTTGKKSNEIVYNVSSPTTTYPSPTPTPAPTPQVNGVSKYDNPMADEARRSRSIKSFIQRFKVEVWLDSNQMKSRLTSNPFQWKGKVVGFVAEFGGMLTEDSGVFDLDLLSLIVVKRLPSARFTRSGEKFLLAGRVQGVSQVAIPMLGTAPVPELSFIGAEAAPR